MNIKNMTKITKNLLKQIVVEQQINLKIAKNTKRTALDEMRKYFDLPQAVIVAGIRRCGKSTLLRQIMSELGGNFYYFNFEDERLMSFTTDNFNDLYECLIEIQGQHSSFFFDEIQNVPGWERFVRRLQDEGNKFYITGSNATLLSRELGTRLTGRYLDYVLYPFSFREFLSWKDFSFKKRDLFDTKRRAEIKKYFDEYFAKGGMPEYLQFGSEEALKKVYESIVYRDIMTRYDLRDETAFRELCVYLFSNLAVPFSYTSVKEMLRLGSVNTAKSYIQYLENSFLFFTVNKFQFSYRKQILSPKKVYCIDNAFARVLGFSFSGNQGRLLENLVFLELKRRGFDVFYFSDKNNCEVDFVLRKNNSTEGLVQVCWGWDDEKTRDREIKALSSAMKEIKLKKGLILTMSEEEEIKIPNGKITVLPVYKWLLT